MKPAKKSNPWRNRIVAAALGVVGTCLCVTVAISQLPSSTGAVNQIQPTREVQATATEELPTVTRTARPTNTVNPTRTTQPTVTARTPQPSFTPVPPSATKGPTPTDAPATVAPANTQPPAATVAPTQAPAATQEPTIAPPADTPVPPPPAGDSITLVSLTSPIGAGGDASLVIQTTPGANCFLAYTTPSGTPSTAQGLGPTVANGEGRCGWSWRIGGSTNPGTGKLFVSAGTANASFDIVIQ